MAGALAPAFRILLGNAGKAGVVVLFDTALALAVTQRDPKTADLLGGTTTSR